MYLFGFGFNFLMILVILPLTVILTIIWVISRKTIFIKLVGLMWAAIVLLIAVLVILQMFTTKMKVTKNKIYGEYIIDKNKFSGEQADWQYENFKFKITKDNILHFSYKVSNDEYKTDLIPVNFLEQYYSDRLVIGKDTTRHHIMVDNPTLYRDVWNFNYVFNSDKFGNVFFKKKTIFS